MPVFRLKACVKVDLFRHPTNHFLTQEQRPLVKLYAEISRSQNRRHHDQIVYPADPMVIQRALPRRHVPLCIKHAENVVVYLRYEETVMQAALQKHAHGKD